MGLRLGTRAPPHHALVAAAVASSLVLGLAAVLPPTGLPLGGCAFHSLTGIACPTCGATRTFVHLAHGRFADGLLLNPGAAVLFLACVAVSALAVARSTLLRRRVEWRWSDRTAAHVRIAAWAAFLGNWTYLALHGVR